jgi:hypothetical protein
MVQELEEMREETEEAHKGRLRWAMRVADLTSSIGKIESELKRFSVVLRN